jgi:TRAP-type C4-dicarboxylate transport system substrate-binding protein
MKKMGKKKKVLTLIALGLMITVLLCSCSPAGKQDTTQTSQASSGSSEQKASGEKVTMKFALAQSADHPTAKVVAQTWLAEFDEKAENVDIEYYYNAELGTVSQTLESILMGEPLVVATDASNLAVYAPDIDVVTAPYLFTDVKDYQLVAQTDWWQEQCDILYKAGYKVINGTVLFGTRHIIADRPIRSPADLKGAKIRVPDNELAITMMEYMGGTPVPMDISEVYSSISQGLLNGMENPPSVILDSKVYEAAKYLSLTGHQTFCLTTVMSTKVWEKLSPEDQKQLIDIGNRVAADSMVIHTIDEAAFETMKNEGVEIVTDVDVAAFQKAVQPLYEGAISKWSPNLAERIRSEVEAVKDSQ